MSLFSTLRDILRGDTRLSLNSTQKLPIFKGEAIFDLRHTLYMQVIRFTVKIRYIGLYLDVFCFLENQGLSDKQVWNEH